MLLRVAANRLEIKIVDVAPIDARDAVEHIVPVLVGRAQWRLRRAHGVERERPARGRRPQSLVRIDVDTGGMRDADQLQPIDEHRLLELVGDTQVVAAVPHAAADSRPMRTYSSGSGTSLRARARPRAHLSAAHEVGHELESRAVPRVEERTG